MDIRSNKINTANATIEATIPMEDINASVDEIAKELAKTANIQGFRKGKAPATIVKKQYSQKLIEDAEAQALRDLLSKGLEELGIKDEDLIGEPVVLKFDKQDDKIDVEIKIAIKPTIECENIASLVPDFEKPTVDEKEVDEKIEELAQNQAQLVNIKRNRMMRKGDVAVIDFEGFIDGEAFAGGKGENHELELGSGQFIPGFEDQLIGVKRDENVTIKVTFPENYDSEELAGKDAEFKVKVNQIKVKEEVAIDDEFAKKLLPNQEDATLDMLKEEVKKALESEKTAKLYDDELKPKLLEKLVESIEFDIPEFVLEQEIDMAANKKASSMSEDEIKELKENKEKLEELRESVREESKESVKATFIIDAIAKEKNIGVSEQDVIQTIYIESIQMGQNPQQVYEHYKNNGYLPAIQMSLIENKVLNILLDEKAEL